MMTLALIIVMWLAIVIMYFYHHPYVQVIGDSMFPTYVDGQYLKAVRVKNSTVLKENEVYVFKTLANEVAIKRLDHISDLGLFFVGDNIQCSFDSRSYGYVPRENVIAQIINP